MNALDYYRSEFGGDLKRIVDASGDRNRLSIVSLVPSNKPSRSFQMASQAFDQVSTKRLFLFCYFFSVLIDQSIHSGLREEHTYFDQYAQHPKFCGILATYYSNLHPAALLLVATLYTPENEQEISIKEFNELSDFFIDDYCNFFKDQSPNISGRLKTAEQQNNAIASVLNEMSSALAILFVPVRISPYTTCEPDNNLYEKWLSYFRTKVNQRLDMYK